MSDQSPSTSEDLMKQEEDHISDQDDRVIFVRKEDEDLGEDSEGSLDDTLLIQAYNSAISKYTKKLDGDGDVATKSAGKRSAKKKAKPVKWAIGDVVLAKYSEDGEFYEAEVIGLDPAEGVATVRYAEYEEEGTVLFDDLKKIPKAAMGGKVDQRPDSTQSQTKWCVGDACLARYYGNGKWYECDIVAVDFSAGTCTVQYAGYEETGEHSLSDLARLPGAGDFYDHEGGSCDFLSVPMVPPPPPPPGLLDSRPRGEEDAVHSMLMAWYMSGFHTGYYQALRDVKKKPES